MFIAFRFGLRLHARYFLLLLLLPPLSTLFPYTTLFRSVPSTRTPPSSPSRSAWRRPDDCSDNAGARSEEHTSELQSRQYLVCRLLLEKKKFHPIAPSFPRTDRLSLQPFRSYNTSSPPSW